jgi:hypothetical protein
MGARKNVMQQATNCNKSVLLEERVAIGKAPPGGRVDRKSKLIRGVKILGFHSRNPGAVLGKDFADMAGYDYDPAAIKEALPLYEGALVNLDHLESKRDGNGMRVPEGSRHVKQRFGKLQNVRVESDGAYADIRYLDNHPLTPMVLEAAEEMPDVFTMSHHAHGEVERCNDHRGNDKRGKVKKINQVHSVDLIAERPGTTTSLFESSPMDDDSAMTSEAAAQSNASTDETAGNSGRPSRGCDSRASFCHEVMAACKDADLDLAGTVLQVLGAILKAAKSAPRGPKECPGRDDDTYVAEDDDGTEAEESADDDSDQAMQESLGGTPSVARLRKRVSLLESREKACILLSQRGLMLTPELITAVAAQRDADAQQTLIESLAAAPPGKATSAPPSRPALKPFVSRPRSAAPLPVSAGKAVRLGPSDATQELLLSLGRARLK